MHDDTLCCGSIFGQEKNVVNAAIAKMNLFLHGASDFNVLQGDTLRDPKILQSGNIAKFDCVIANPPFSLENWGSTEWASDKYKRNLWGTPSDSCGDFAWIQHMIASMAPAHGRMAVVMPQGVLFRGNQDGEIRKKNGRKRLDRSCCNSWRQVVLWNRIVTMFLDFAKNETSSTFWSDTYD